MRDPGTTVDTTTAPALGLTRAYRRRPEVEAEIRALPDPGDPTFRAAAEAAQASETLVYAIRALVRTGREAAANSLADALIQRAAPLVARLARNQFLRSPADQEDLMQMTAVQMWQEVFDTRGTQEFWEVHFKWMVSISCSEAADRLRAQRAHERPFARGVTSEGDTWSEEDTLADPHEPETRFFLNEALAQLDDNVRRAVYLKFQGFKEASKDPTEITISRLLGVSDRTVRTYLRTGERLLREWMEAGS
jgi:RNA polymerase sigma factor (sigma-70 family)